MEEPVQHPDLFVRAEETMETRQAVDGSLVRTPTPPKQLTISKRKAVINSLRFYRP